VTLVFLGTPSWAVPSLEALLRAGHAIPLVVTQPDRPVGRSGTPRPTPVKEAARRAGIEVAQPRRVKDTAFLDLLASRAPDLLVVVAYGRILPRAVLDLAPRGAVNLHFSLLPRYRGAAPVQWALANGETVTGVSVMRMEEELDAGDVYIQVEVPIPEGEHAPALGARLAEVGARALADTLSGWDAAVRLARPQEPAAVTWAPLLRPEDGEADLLRPAREIEGRVRGFDPWPGQWARRAGRRVRLVEARALPGRVAPDPPGTVFALEREALLVACGAGTVLAVSRIQPEGRPVRTAREAVNGRQIAPGDRLEVR